MGIKDTLVTFSNNNPLFKIQIFYFFYEGATKSLPRYLGLYYKHTLLLSPHQVAVLLSARSFALLFGSPILGTIADKLNRFRNVLILCLFAYLITYFTVPFVEAVDGFNCKNHFNDSKHLQSVVLNNSLITREDGRFKVKIHKYNSELKVDPLGQHYHGNLMYDLFYTWPLETWEYLATDDITKNVFITLLVITIIGEFFASPSETIADLYTLQALGSEQRKYGLIIIPGLLGWVVVTLIFSIISNAKVDLKDDFCHIGHVTNYSPYLFVFYAMIFICIVMAFMLKFNRYQSTTSDEEGYRDSKCSCNLYHAIPIFLSTPAYLAFTVVVIFVGFGNGVKQLYIYHYITDLGGSVILLPIIVAVHFVSDIIALLVSPYLLSKYGSVKILNVGLFTYAITFIVYSVIENPLLIFLVEPLNGITSQLCWVAIVTYIGSPPRVGAAMQGLTHGLYRGLGISIGYLAVSVFILKYGYFTFFVSIGLSFFFVLIFFTSVTHFFPKKESVAEAYSHYRLLFPENNNQSDDESEEENIYNKKEEQNRRKENYENAVLDSSFLE